MHGACTRGTGIDDCAAGLVCVGASTTASCERICKTDADCNAYDVCASYSGLFGNGAALPPAGVCSQRCNPLSQLRGGEFGAPVPCGAGRGCYVQARSTGDVAVCAPAGAGAHNMPITAPEAFANSCAPGHMPRVAVQGTSNFECGALCKPADVYSGRNESYEGGDTTGTNWVNQPATCESAGGVTTLPEVPGTGESCRFWWARQGGSDQDAFSNSLGFCFNHGDYRYDPDGQAPWNATAAMPRCPTLSADDIVPPVDAQSPHNDAQYFGCMSMGERTPPYTPVLRVEPVFADRFAPLTEP
jgi:hypothetical protein